jgi:hypothetical protein
MPDRVNFDLACVEVCRNRSFEVPWGTRQARGQFIAEHPSPAMSGSESCPASPSTREVQMFVVVRVDVGRRLKHMVMGCQQRLTEPDADSSRGALCDWHLCVARLLWC